MCTRLQFTWMLTEGLCFYTLLIHFGVIITHFRICCSKRNWWNRNKIQKFSPSFVNVIRCNVARDSLGIVFFKKVFGYGSTFLISLPSTTFIPIINYLTLYRYTVSSYRPRTLPTCTDNVFLEPFSVWYGGPNWK